MYVSYREAWNGDSGMRPQYHQRVSVHEYNGSQYDTTWKPRLVTVMDPGDMFQVDPALGQNIFIK